MLTSLSLRLSSFHKRMGKPFKVAGPPYPGLCNGSRLRAEGTEVSWSVGAPCDWLLRDREERGGMGLTSLTSDFAVGQTPHADRGRQAGTWVGPVTGLQAWGGGCRSSLRGAPRLL